MNVEEQFEIVNDIAPQTLCPSLLKNLYHTAYLYGETLFELNAIRYKDEEMHINIYVSLDRQKRRMLVSRTYAQKAHIISYRLKHGDTLLIDDNISSEELATLIKRAPHLFFHN